MDKRNGVLQPSGSGQVLLLVGVAVVGLNLRPFLTATGPIAAQIAADTGLDYQGMAWLTLVPMLLMGVFAFLAPQVQRHFGARRAVLLALVVLALGSLLRAVVPGGGTLIATAALCGLGVAVIQAVFPGIIKQQFPGRVAMVTGLYSSALMTGGALGAQFSPLLADWSGSWRLALGWFAVPAVLALILGFWSLPRTVAQSGGRPAVMVFLSRPRTWLLMASFGLVNAGYSTLVAWLAPFYQVHGWSSAASGGLVALMAIGQGAAALTLPALASRYRDRRPWLWLTLVLQAAGFLSLAFWPDLAPRVFAVVVGMGLGGCFALSLVVALDHLPDPAGAGTLSALMQGGGFLIAALGPWVAAVLHQITGGFTAGWLAHLACVATVLVLTFRLSPGGYAAAMVRPVSAGLEPAE